jgi:NAD+ kinase
MAAFKPFKRIGIAVKERQPGLVPVLGRVLRALDGQDVEVVLEEEAASLVSDLPVGGARLRTEVVEGADLVIVLGGDGTTLAVLRDIGTRPIPVLGINLGRLGFLTDVAADEIEGSLRAVLGGECGVRERSRLEVQKVGDAADAAELVLNDAVFTKGTVLARMIELRTHVDGRPVADYHSDGLIVSTPTGSTAYNLSAGGPLLDPDLPAMILSPICPHTLSQRPLVLSDARVVEVELFSSEDAILTLDGQVGVRLASGDRVRITRSAHPARFVVVPGHNPFETLRTKLGWGAW